MPGALKRAGITDSVWTDPVAADRFCERHGLPLPPEVYWSSPRALRDHAAVEYARKHWPSQYPGIPDWHKMYAAGVAPISGARMVARRAAVDA